MKKYWDVICGIILGALLSFMAGFKTDLMQQIYSIIILLLVSIGFFKIIRETIEKKINTKTTIIDKVAEHQRPLRAIRFASYPMQTGEELGKTLIKIYERSRTMKNLKNIFDKFKGYILAIALAILTIVEYCGGFINELCGGILVVGGIELLPLITLVASILVGCLSNPYDTDQRKNIREFLQALAKNKTITNDIVKAEIKKQIKEYTEKLAALNKELKALSKQGREANDNIGELKTVYEAKQKMFEMIPQLATSEEVQIAQKNVEDAEKAHVELEESIKKVEADIQNIEKTMAVLREQL